LDESHRSILAAIALGRSLETEPIAVSQWIRQLTLHSLAGDMQALLQNHGFNDTQLAAMAEAFREAASMDTIARSLEGNRAKAHAILKISASDFAKAFLQDPSGSSGDVPFQSKAKAGFWKVSGVIQKDYLFYLSRMEELIRISLLPESERHATLTQIKDRVRHPIHGSFKFSNTVMLQTEGWIEFDLRLKATVRAVITALALERARLAHGQLPGTLDALVPQFLDRIPADPYNSQPLRYKKLPKGYVVYSLGPDGRDQGGKEPPHWYEPAANCDLTFIVEK
jgi:hypothetical protein